MIQSYGRGIGGAKVAWLPYFRFRVAPGSSCRLRLVGSSRRQGVAMIRRIYALEVSSANGFGRTRLGGFCRAFSRVSRNSLAILEVGAPPRKGFAMQVNGSFFDPPGWNSDVQDEESSGDDITVVAAVLGLQAENGFHGLNAAVEAEDELEDFQNFESRELILHSEAVVASRRWELEEDDRELQAPGESERWWRIPDFVHEVLPLPKTFDPQLQIVHDKLGCRIHSRELLLRIMVHKSYYLSKMPQALKDRKLKKPLMSWRRVETTSNDDNLMTFADAHGEARLQLALLGDTVLNLAASHYLIRQHPLVSTGLITERRSQLVCNSNLARVWSTLLNLRELVLCDPPLSQSKKPSATTIMESQMKACADTLEAYVGGLYVEKGLESALRCVETRLLPLLLLADPTRNPVALLHEQCVIQLQEKPDYKLIGVDNKNTANESCRIRVYVKGFRLSTGIGKSQKLARRDAAEKALVKWPQVFGSSA